MSDPRELTVDDVTEADRDAASAYLATRDVHLRGDYRNSLAWAFAEHRVAAVARCAALELERDAAVGQLQDAPVRCGCHPGVRWTVESWGQICPLTQAIAERDAARAAVVRARADGLREAIALAEARITECAHDRADAVSFEEGDDTYKRLNGCSRCWEAADIAGGLRALIGAAALAPEQQPLQSEELSPARGIKAALDWMGRNVARIVDQHYLCDFAEEQYAAGWRGAIEAARRACQLLAQEYESRSAMCGAFDSAREQAARACYDAIVALRPPEAPR